MTTPNAFTEEEAEGRGVDLRGLPPCTTLLVRTTNSLYRLVVNDGPTVSVQGGTFFPSPTTACVPGARIGGSYIRAGWIGVGMRLEIRSAGQRISTSAVRGITTLPPAPGSCLDSAAGFPCQPCTG